MQASWIEKQAIDREVASLCIFFSGTVGHAVRVSPVAVALVAAEGGHFDVAGVAGSDDRDDTKGDADVAGPPAAEDLPNLLGSGVGGDIVVLRPFAAELITHTAAGPQRLVPALAKLADNAQREFLGGVRINASRTQTATAGVRVPKGGWIGAKGCQVISTGKIGAELRVHRPAAAAGSGPP